MAYSGDGVQISAELKVKVRASSAYMAAHYGSSGTLAPRISIDGCVIADDGLANCKGHDSYYSHPLALSLPLFNVNYKKQQFYWTLRLRSQGLGL
jgi:hypothetical protein